MTQGEAAKSMLMAPLIAGGEVRGRISLQNLDKTHAFSEADVAAPEHDRVEPGRRARERPPLRRDEAPPDRDRRAGRRAGHHQRRPAGPGGGSSTCRRCTTSSATRSRRSSTRRSSTSPSSTARPTSSTSPTRSSGASGCPTSDGADGGVDPAVMRDTRQPVLIERDIVGTSGQARRRDDPIGRTRQVGVCGCHSSAATR